MLGFVTTNQLNKLKGYQGAIPFPIPSIQP